MAMPVQGLSHRLRGPALPPLSASDTAPHFAVIVMGVSGCGKSTLGSLLGTALDAPFLEGDDFHAPEAVAKMRAGQALTDDDRWPWLDRIGVAANAAITDRGRTVIACSALRAAYRARLRAAIAAPVRFILLENSRERLLARLAARADHYMPTSLLDSQLATLERPDEDEGAMILTTDADPCALRDAALRWLR
ncbi:gluconokinase [Sphingobium sp. 10 DY56-G10]|nr:Carbohydrate kinase, thermoresistant glucokinase [Sphingomonas sp. SKA58]